MKFLIVAFAFVAAATAQYNLGQYNPGQYRQQYSTIKPFQRNPYPTPAPYRPYVTSTLAPPTAYTPAPVYPSPLPVRVNNQDARVASTVRLENEIFPNGAYNYLYETDNGIAAQEQGVPRAVPGTPPSEAVVAQGGFSYTSPEGVPVAITYIADEFGFQPQGNVIPTSPPIPPLIARALAYIASQPPQQSSRLAQ